jgi:hypothetical protein
MPVCRVVAGHVPAIAYFHCCVKDAEALHKAETIGQAVSSGCIRLFNQDIIDLYNRVPVGTHVTVVQG